MNRLRFALLLTVGILVTSDFTNTLGQDYEVTVTNVMVWVKATDKSGNPVKGLSQSDFELFEDGKKVDSLCFEETIFPVESLEEPVESESSPKHLVFLVDLSNTAENELLHIREVISDFLKKISHSWSVSVISLYNGLIEMNVEGSTDRSELDAALRELKANQKRDIDAVNNRRQLSTVLRVAVGGRLDPRMLSETCDLARDLALQEKMESKLWLDSLRQFDKYIKKQSIDSHAVVLFLSGGVSSDPGRQYFDLIRDSKLVRAMVGDEYQLRRDYPECEGLDNSDHYRELEKLIGKLNTNNVTFYAVSTRGPINSMLDTIQETDRRVKLSDLDFLKNYQDFLARIADDTGGTYFGNSLNFDKGFDSILSDLNHQYLLCYKPPEHSEADYHKIKVKSKKSGVKLRYRNGYFD